MARPSRFLALSTALMALATVAAAGPAAADGCPRVVSSTIADDVLFAGDGTVQTVVLDRPAPAGGVFLDLAGDNVGYRESTLGGVRLAGGERRLTLPVRFTHGLGGAHTWRDMTASTDCSQVATDPVTVRPLDPDVLAVQSVAFRPRVALPGTSITFRITLTAPARPTGTTLALYGGGGGGPSPLSSDLIATVPAGELFVDLPVRTREVVGEPLPYTMGALLSSTGASGDVTVLPRGLYVSSTLPADRTESRQRVSLGRRAPAGGAVVRLRDTRSDIDYPARVVVPAGACTTTFRVRTPDPRGTGEVTATWDGRSTTRTITFG